MIQQKPPFVSLLIPGTWKKKSTTPPLQLSHRMKQVVALDDVFDIHGLLGHDLQRFKGWLHDKSPTKIQL